MTESNAEDEKLAPDSVQMHAHSILNLSPVCLLVYTKFIYFLMWLMNLSKRKSVVKNVTLLRPIRNNLHIRVSSEAMFFPPLLLSGLKLHIN